MAHCDAVINRDRVELFCNTTSGFNLARNHLAQILQVNMTGHELGERVDDGNDRFAKIIVTHACGTPKATCAGHVAAMG